MVRRRRVLFHPLAMLPVVRVSAVMLRPPTCGAHGASPRHFCAPSAAAPAERSTSQRSAPLYAPDRRATRAAVHLRVWRPRAAAAVGAAEQRRRTAPGRAPRLSGTYGWGWRRSWRTCHHQRRGGRVPRLRGPFWGQRGDLSSCRLPAPAGRRGLPQQTRPSSASGASSWVSALPERSSQRSPRSMAAPEALPTLSSQGVDLAASSSREAPRAALADSPRWAPSQRPRRCARRSCACTGAGGRLDLAPFGGPHGNRLAFLD